MIIDYDKFGGRKAYLKTISYQIVSSIGLYERFTRIQWDRVKRLIFICDGNICRSPFAEACAVMQGLPATSGGLDTENGHPANSDAIVAAATFGIDLLSHTTQAVTTLQLTPNDLIFLMQPSQIGRLNRLIDCNVSAQVTLLGLWRTPSIPYLQDPYGRSQRCFMNCFQIIHDSVRQISKCIRTNNA